MSPRIDDLISLDAIFDIAVRRFQLAITQITDRAIEAEGDAHLVLKGERRGWQAALQLLERIRTEERQPV